MEIKYLLYNYYVCKAMGVIGIINYYRSSGKKAKFTAIKLISTT